MADGRAGQPSAQEPNRPPLDGDRPPNRPPAKPTTGRKADGRDGRDGQEPDLLQGPEVSPEDAVIRSLLEAEQRD